MNKKSYQVWMDPEAHKKIKVWAAESDLPIGDAIQQMVERLEERAEYRRQLLKDAGLTTEAKQPTLSLALVYDETIQSMLDNAEELKNTESGWAGDVPGVKIKHDEHGTKADLNSLVEMIRKHEEENENGE